MDFWIFGWFSLLVFITYLIGGVAGFGGTVLALAATASFIDIKVAVPGLLIIGTIQSYQALISNHPHADGTALKRMVIWAAAGVPVGVVSARYLDQRALNIIVAIVSILSGLSRFLPILPRQLPRGFDRVMNLLLLCAGVIHGAFAAGGAPAVIVAQHIVPQKESFRATLFVFWALMNTVAVVLYLATERFTHDGVWLGVAGLPAVLLATYLADHSAKRISQTAFGHISASLLIAAGIITLTRSLIT